MNDFDDIDDVEFEQFATAKPITSSIPPSKTNPTLTDKQLYKHILQRAVNYLSRREHAQQELKSKLKRAFIAQEFSSEDDQVTLESLIESALGYLAQHNWQSDERFAQQVSKVKGERYGSARVKHKLNSEGIAREVIDQTMADMAQTEFARALEVWERKFGTLPSTAPEYAKQTRFMAYRGFSFDIIKKILKGEIEDF